MASGAANEGSGFGLTSAVGCEKVQLEHKSGGRSGT